MGRDERVHESRGCERTPFRLRFETFVEELCHQGDILQDEIKMAADLNTSKNVPYLKDCDLNGGGLWPPSE